jgi:uncharacterized protein HemX
MNMNMKHALVALAVCLPVAAAADSHYYNDWQQRQQNLQRELRLQAYKNQQLFSQRQQLYEQQRQNWRLQQHLHQQNQKPFLRDRYLRGR